AIPELLRRTLGRHCDRATCRQYHEPKCSAAERCVTIERVTRGLSRGAVCVGSALPDERVDLDVYWRCIVSERGTIVVLGADLDDELDDTVGGDLVGSGIHRQEGSGPTIVR